MQQLGHKDDGVTVTVTVGNYAVGNYVVGNYAEDLYKLTFNVSRAGILTGYTSINEVIYTTILSKVEVTGTKFTVIFNLKAYHLCQFLGLLGGCLPTLVEDLHPRRRHLRVHTDFFQHIMANYVNCLLLDPVLNPEEFGPQNSILHQ